MASAITSKNMASVSELTLVADIRPELVEIRETMSHATRLRILLRTLYGIRRAAVEEGVGRASPARSSPSSSCTSCASRSSTGTRSCCSR